MASITFYQNRVVIIEAMVLPHGMISPPGMEEKRNNQLATLTHSVGVQILVALIMAAYQVFEDGGVVL